MTNQANPVTQAHIDLVLKGASYASVAKEFNLNYNSLYSKVYTQKHGGTTMQAQQPIVMLPAAPVVEETVEEIRAKLTERFAALDLMAQATLHGTNKSLIVSGPAGLGKSHSVMVAAEKYEKTGANIAVVKGFVRPTGLYKVLYEHRNKGDVVIFDDADSVFADDVALNLLKGACDMTKRRTLSWRAETKMEDESGEQLPTSFEFEGSVIFITNVDFDWCIARDNSRAVHFQAMISRSIYLDLMMKTTRDYLVRIEQIAPAIFEAEKVSKVDGDAVLAFITENAEQLRELSLRMVLKLISLIHIDRARWQQLARTTCFKTKE